MTKNNGHNNDSGKKPRKTAGKPSHETRNATKSVSFSRAADQEMLPNKLEQEPFPVADFGASAGGLETDNEELIFSMRN